MGQQNECALPSATGERPPGDTSRDCHWLLDGPTADSDDLHFDAVANLQMQWEEWSRVLTERSVRDEDPDRIFLVRHVAFHPHKPPPNARVRPRDNSPTQPHSPSPWTANPLGTHPTRELRAKAARRRQTRASSSESMPQRLEPSDADSGQQNSVMTWTMRPWRKRCARKPHQPRFSGPTSG